MLLRGVCRGCHGSLRRQEDKRGLTLVTSGSPIARTFPWVLSILLGSVGAACGSDPDSRQRGGGGSSGGPVGGGGAGGSESIGGSGGSGSIGGAGGSSGGSGSGGAGGSSGSGTVAGECPASLPATGAPCSGQLECTYFDCAGDGQTTARCNASAFALETLPCLAFVCGGAGGPECEPGNVCIERGTGLSRECVANPCGTSVVSCECAGSFCDGAPCSSQGATIHCEP
jgi:hypothetical protein